jgi:BlaR1 peptidase M56
MIAQLLLLALVVSLCCAMAAAIGEGTLALRRGVPVRWVWVAAMLVSVTVPVARVSFSSQQGAPRSGVSMSVPRGGALSGATDVRTDSSGRDTNTKAQAVTPALAREFGAVRPARTSPLRVPRISRRTSFLFAGAWLTASLSLLGALLWSFRRLARDRERWSRATLHDTEVLVSDGFGPALVGFKTPEIVLPPWVLTLDDAASMTILGHETEHRRSGDSRLIVGARLLSIAMPWNPLLWWMTARLVRAVEFDCDARVIARGVNSATYADLLLGAWQHGMADRRFALSTAFAERRSKLGQRVRHLLRPEPRGTRVRAVFGASSVVLFTALAAAAPTPRITSTIAGPAPVSLQAPRPARLFVIDGTALPELNTPELQGAEWRTRMAESMSFTMSVVDTVNARRIFGDIGANGAEVWWTWRYLDRVGPQLPVAYMLVQTLWAPFTLNSDGVSRISNEELAKRMAAPLGGPAFEKLTQQVLTRLIAGLELTPAQTLQAHSIVLRYLTALHGVSVMRNHVLVAGPKVVALTNSRDSALRQMLTNDTQRSRFTQTVALERRFLFVTGAHETADFAVREGFFGPEDNSDFVAATDGEFAAAITVVERSLIDEATLSMRAPDDTVARRALLLKRTADVRRVLDNDEKRAAFDRRQKILGGW